MTTTLQNTIREEAEITIHVEPDESPVRGNALASGDDAADREEEDRILAELEAGNVWAWALVRVRVKWNGFTEDEYLGGCSYEGEHDFRTDGYFDDMVSECVDRITKQAARIAAIALGRVAR